VRQFLSESVFLCSIAFALAILLAWSVLPLFNSLANKQLSFRYLLDVPLVSSFAGLFVFTSLAVGFYPAIVLSGFRPVETLTSMQVTEKNYLSRSLMVVQFALASFLIIVTTFVNFQYDFLTHTNLGYDEENLLVINANGQEENFQLLNEFKLKLSRVQNVLSVGSKMNGGWGTMATVDGRRYDIDYDRIDEDYLPTLGVPVVQGRNFSTDFPSDSTHSALVNEAFVKEVGWKDPIGQTIDFDHKLVVVGVVKDYHYASLKEKIYPKLFTMDPKVDLGRFIVRLKPGDMDKSAMDEIEMIHKTLIPNHPIDYYFVKIKNQMSYDAENKSRQIITYAAIITIFISCIGLLGLTLLSVRKRTREIGVRKILGAGEWQIVMLVSKNFIGLILLSFFLAAPIAGYVTGRWLENFPYRIPMHGWVFVATAALTLLIALLTVSLQAIRAANANPVTSLRSQ
jgi:putative ABC transport system permease protein